MCRISFFLNLLDQNNILNIIRVCMFIIFYIFYIFFEFSTSYCGSSIFKIISWPFCELKNLLKFSLTISSLFNNFSKSISSSFSFFVSFLFLISLLFFNYFEFSDNETFPSNETIKADRMNISTDPGNGLWTITKTNGH